MIEPVWFWAIVGIVLVAFEILAIGTLYALWFGLAALCLSFATWLAPDLPYTVQFIAFAILSAVSLWVWKRYDKKTDKNFAIGQSRGEEIGRVGVVTATTGPAQSGMIHFAQGLMGSKEWIAISDEIIEAGAHARVVAVEGNTLRISKSL
ncbi:MAG: NfeD family protein [Betaproteobacteria bacterium HGW-Betaproteobacteria-22]|nr:MAG: NfeD family protein [Betaproteobacteria bacterium HGW-Betaproteobacteria-22]